MTCRSTLLTLSAFILALPLGAQEPAPSPSPDPWSGTLGFGLALTSGNSDTRSYNLSFSATRDPKARNVFKAEGLYLRAEQDGEATADKTSLAVRDELALSARTFAFGQVGFLRDRFKQLDSLFAPLVGVGLRAVDEARAKLTLDAGLGGAFEKLEGRDATTSGAVQAGQSLTLVLSPSATLTQGVTALWKMEDFGDAIYRIQAGLTTTVARRLELKLAYTRDIKTRPPQVVLEKSDDSLLVNLVLKL